MDFRPSVEDDYSDTDRQDSQSGTESLDDWGSDPFSEYPDSLSDTGSQFSTNRDSDAESELSADADDRDFADWDAREAEEPLPVDILLLLLSASHSLQEVILKLLDQILGCVGHIPDTKCDG